MNPVAESLTGWKEAEALGMRLVEVFRAIEEATGQAIEHEQVYRVPNEGLPGRRVDLRLVGKGGIQTAIEETVAPLRNRDGGLMGLVLVFRDTGERKRAEAALRKAFDEMEMRVQQRTEDCRRQIHPCEQKSGNANAWKGACWGLVSKNKFGSVRICTMASGSD